MQLNDHNKRRMLIDGELTGSAGGQWLPSVNPATEEIIGHIPAGNAEDVERAAAAAERAYPAWQALGIEGRAERMREVARRLTEAAEAVLAVEVADTGNTVTALKDDVAAAAWGLNFYAGLGYELKGETIPATADSLHFTVREPYGVVGRIVPFNHPILFAAARTVKCSESAVAGMVSPLSS